MNRGGGLGRAHAHLRACLLPPCQFQRGCHMTALTGVSTPAKLSLEPGKVNLKAMNVPGASAAPVLVWLDKTPSAVYVSPRTPYPPVRHSHSDLSRGPSPCTRLPKALSDPPVAPLRPRRPDSIVEDAENVGSPPAYDPSSGFSPVVDLGYHLDDLISTYIAEPSPEVTDAAMDSPQDPLGSKWDGTAASTDTHAAIMAALAEFGLEGLTPRPSSPILPGSERARQLLPLRQRTLHLGGLPGYERRIDLLQKLEIAMSAFMSIEDVEAVLNIEAVSRSAARSVFRADVCTDEASAAPACSFARTKKVFAKRRSGHPRAATDVLATQATCVGSEYPVVIPSG